MKNLALKIVCILAAVVIWVFVASTTLVEADVSLPLKVVGLDERWTVEGSGLPEVARVRLRAPKLALLRNDYFGVPLGQVHMDVTGYEPGPVELYSLKESDVRTEANVITLLPPVRLALHIDWLERRPVPVEVPLRGQLPVDRMLAGPIITEPESLLVVGPRRFFEELELLVTEPFDLGEINGTVVRDASVAPPGRGLRLESTTVRLTVPVIRLDDRVVANVPVLAEAAGELFDVGVSPPVCDVLVRGPADSIATLTAADLRVTVPIADSAAGMHQVIGMVQHPAWVIAVRLEPESFMVILEEPQPAVEEPR